MDLTELELIHPDASHAQSVMDYRDEFLRCESSLDGTAGLVKYAEYTPWFEAVRRNADEKTVAPGLVPSTTLLCVRKCDGVLVGMIDIRHRLNEYLLRRGGHIGYSVRPQERRKGYATAMLALALDRCRALQITRALVTCDNDNIASAKTILHCGGVFENEVPDGETCVRRYWIAL